MEAERDGSNGLGTTGAEAMGAEATDLKEGVEEGAQLRILGYLQHKGTRGSDKSTPYIWASLQQQTTDALGRNVKPLSAPRTSSDLHECDSPSFHYKLHILMLNTWMLRFTFHSVGTAESRCEDHPSNIYL